ncbi:MAG: PAS domain S-box protein, partial [Balneolales bacterium]|nr:PAS domain S-box protein [Balneolales bacterium]
LFQIKESKVRNFSSGSGIRFRNTYSIAQTGTDDIWIQGYPQFMLRYNAENKLLENFNRAGGLVRNFQYLFADPSDDTIYSYNDRTGLWKFVNEAWERQSWFDPFFTPRSPGITATHRNREGLLFLGTTEGLIVKSDESLFLANEKTGQQLNRVRIIREQDDGTLWMGTNGSGLFRLNPTDWSFQQYTTEDGLSSNFIRDIHLAAADTLWLATQDRGLNRIILGSDGTISSSASILPSDGLLNHGLHRIIPDQFGYLWVNSNGGIMRFSVENLNAYASGKTSLLQILKLTENQGLINSEGNGGVDNAGLMLQNGLIVFPNQAGVAIINPQDFINLKTERLNRPVIDRFTFNNESLQAGLFQEIVLPLGNRDFRVSFTLPNYSNPDLITFSYRLEGLNSTWRNPVSGRTAVFTNVPAGEYRLQVRAARPDGTFQTVSLPVVVPPHFYETIWFFIFCILLGLITIGILHRSRTKTLRLREMRTRSLLELQTCYVIRTDLAGNYTYANPKFIEVFGFLYKNNESRTIDYQGRNCMSSIAPEDQQKVKKTIDDLIAQPYKVIQVDMRKPLKDGTKAFTLWDFSVVFGLNNKPAEIQCVGIDYTERKKQEKQLKESEHKLQRTIESVPHPMLIVDENLSIQFVNEEFQRVFGYEEPEILGESAVKLLPDSSNSDHIKRLWNRIRSQENVKRIGGFQAVLSKNGNEIAVFMSLNHFSSGGRKSTIIILQDVTELKIQQDVILKQNKTLRDIAWHQSHVVRRPVANILGLIDFITSYPEETLHQQKELLEMLRTSALELDEIVKDMVRMSNDSEFER